jgi:hypothetical protein
MTDIVPITDSTTRSYLIKERDLRRAEGDEQAATIIQCDLDGADYPEDVLSLPRVWDPNAQDK